MSHHQANNITKSWYIQWLRTHGIPYSAQSLNVPGLRPVSGPMMARSSWNMLPSFQFCWFNTCCVTDCNKLLYYYITRLQYIKTNTFSNMVAQSKQHVHTIYNILQFSMFPKLYFWHPFHNVCIFNIKPAKYYHMHIYTVIICMYKVTFHQI